MRIGRLVIDTVDDCIDILEDAFQSGMWKQLPDQERTRLVSRVSHILEIVENEVIEGEVSGYGYD